MLKNLKNMSDLKQERINQMIKRQIEEIEHPHITQRPNNLDIKPRPTLMGEDADLDFFGYDLFIDAPLSFTPIPDMPVPEDHILGPGDNIKVALFGVKSDEYTLRITRDGYAIFPDIGPILLGGLTFSEAKKITSKKVSDYMTGLEGFISMGTLRTIQVYVVGDAYQPGSYNLSSLSTVTHALFISGGIRTTGSLRNIQVKRKGETVIDFDFYDFLLKGDNSKDVTLRSGDVIFIPPVGKTVGIAGEVRRPAIFELKDEETTGNLLQYAGGLLPTADLSSFQVGRVLQGAEGTGYTLVHFDLASTSADTKQLKDGDIVNIYPVVNAMQNVVLFTGYTQKPGFHEWKDNLRVTDIIKSEKELLPETDRNYVLIKRENELTGEYQALQLDLNLIFSNKNSEENIVLNKRDEVFFFSKRPDKSETDASVDGQNVEKNMAINPVKELIVVKDDAVSIIEKSELDAYMQKGYKRADFLMKPGSKTADELIMNSLEIFVVKDNLVELITLDEWPLYQTEGYDKAVLDKDAEYAQTVEKVIDEDRGERSAHIEPFLTILRSQDTSNTPVRIVHISGNVHYPGEYPQTKNMTLKQLIQAGGGLKHSTYIEDIELTRKSIRNNRYQIARSNISGKDKQSLQTKLQAGDAVLIKAIEDVTKVVEVKGEVFFPGEYSLQEGDTLSSLIERAGGLKNTAFSQGAVFLRESIKRSETERLQRTATRLQKEMILGITAVGLGSDADQSAASLAPVLEMLDESSQDELALGRLVINLDKILKGNYSDIILEDGDSINIPKEQQSISVIGEVYVPTSHIFNPSLQMKDYINSSGGETKFADLDGSYIIKANGAIILSSGGSNRFFRNISSTDSIDPGDTIVVPLRTNQFNSLKAATDITQILYQMALAAAADQQFLDN